jgi:hypothetical protein
MSTIVEEVRERIARYPHAEIQHDETSIIYYPSNDDGFIVRLLVQAEDDRECYSVYYGGCRQEELDRKGSGVTFGLGLSNGCRLREFSRDSETYHWITDIEGYRGWRPYWEDWRLCPAFWRFWRRAKVQVLQNKLIDLGSGGCGGGGSCAAQ